MPRVKPTSSKRKRSHHVEEYDDSSDFSEYDSDFSEVESDYDFSEDEYSESESDEDPAPRRRRAPVSRGRKATKKKATKKKATKKKATKRKVKKTKRKVKKAKKSSTGLSEKRLKGRNIPVPMFSAVVEAPKDAQGNPIPPPKKDRKFLLVDEKGAATTKAYTAKGPYQAALKAANRLEVDTPTVVRLREPNSQIMFVFDGERKKLAKEDCIYFHCQNQDSGKKDKAGKPIFVSKRKKVTYKEKEAIVKKDANAKIIPICHSSQVKRTDRIKLNDLAAAAA